MDGATQQPGFGPDPGVLLRVSEHFLRRRHFDDCRKYAHQAHQAHPNFPGVSEILAVADVLAASEPRISSGTLPDWYAVLQLNRASQDSDLIRRQFNRFHALLNPSNNGFPFADEAFDLVSDAWYVLSNPLKKSEFDNARKKHFDAEKSKEKCGFAFWTVCPYCYYLYEYPRVYLEHCLRCQNEKCNKAFTCVEIDRPPAEVLREGKYNCAGFLPLGFQEGGWNPHEPMGTQKATANKDTVNFVEISDDDDNVDDCSKSVDVKPNVSRKKKLVAKNAKKVAGTGNRVTKEGFVRRNAKEKDLIACSTDEDGGGCEDEIGSGFVGGAINTMKEGDVEFYDADDDILVGLQNGM